MEIYRKFETDDIVQANPSEVSVGLWTGDTGSLTSYFTSSTQTASTAGKYEWDIYNGDPSSSNSEVQFSIAYGNISGSGDELLANNDNSLITTEVTYKQYRNILLEPDDTHFTFGVTTANATYNSDDIWVINIKRSRLKEKMDPGNWVITLGSSSGSDAGSGSPHTYIDDSGQTLGATYGTSGRVFDVVSGSLTGVSGSTIASSASVSGGFGKFYPDRGIIVLNPRALWVVGSVNAPDTSTATHRQNQKILLEAIESGSDFQARSAETVSSTHYFVRVKNKSFNYSNNPSFFNQTTGAITNTDFINDPQVYISTIGLYNDANELVAVAKVSRPVRKSFDREALIRVRLDY